MKEVYDTLGDSHINLLRVDVANQLPGKLVSELPPISHEDKLKLLSLASSLALSENPEDKSLAYEIASRIVDTSSQQSRLISAAAFIMARLGNFPGRQLVTKKYGDNDVEVFHPLLAAEVVTRELGNTVHVAGRPITFTDFQMDFFELLEFNDSASISAPTSAGKSFVLVSGAIDKISKNQNLNIVYVVPTRALLGQVTKMFLSASKQNELNIPVRCVPIPLDPGAETGCVYVLTQERLISLLQAFEHGQIINTLIVDEAQSVGDGSRGVLLHTAIERVKEVNPFVNVYFASPLTRNPGMLMDFFGSGKSRHTLKERHSPVLQNIILVREVKGKPTQANVAVLNDSGEHHVAIIELDFKFRGRVAEQKAKFATSITTEEESTILYCNIQKQTEETADELCKHLDETADQDVYELAEFLKEHIHEEYPLVKTLPKKVAYHYGSMPNIVRTRIEHLASLGKLQYICCTSTLLQGVNLPAKHILIDRPRKGQTKPMGRADFLNLAGRAGRLLKEFQGNVWCLRPESWVPPEGVEEACYIGENTQDIKLSFVEALDDGGTLLSKILKGEPVEKMDYDLGVASLGKIFGDFVLPGIDLATSYLASPETSSSLSELQRECEKIEITVPKEIVHSNPSVHPLRMQRLYNFMSRHTDLDSLLPIHPQRKGAYDRLTRIFKNVAVYLEEEDNNTYMLDVWLAYQWTHDETLKSIIEERIAYLKRQAIQKAKDEGGEIKEVKPRKVIFDLLEFLQDRIRFRYVKNVRVYKQLLAHLLSKAGRQKEAEELIPIDVFLECGSSSPVVLSLIGIGLTRTTALMLKNKVKFPDETTPEMCLGILSTTNIGTMDIPAVCRKEVLELLGLAR